jgi:hypothetical protein
MQQTLAPDCLFDNHINTRLHARTLSQGLLRAVALPLPVLRRRLSLRLRRSCDALDIL